MVDLILKDSEALPERWCVFTHVMGVGWRETSAFVPIHGCSGSQNERPSFVLSARSMFLDVGTAASSEEWDGVRVPGKGLCSQRGLHPPLGMFLALLTRRIFIQLPEVFFIESPSLGTTRMGHFQCF